ncbi:Acetyltransferase (GNAT) family protein [Virgibacillus subterraneus]|uniref:Acetyltransferase (GNAT) family protein n=1 Tax=Virgibacillus subterraneus TaxID=621109 RepID=A0A1H9JU70_9BACI|nr:GNAT family N-acetyltransferase [Virgibacillus subterraneus]SEQ90304.1 Acetyltransferase (GNAT) family protein [Virgibacillus subterraneus]
MNQSIVKANTTYTVAIADICAAGWKQTVEGKLSEEYQTKNVDFWYNHEKVYHDIKAGLYSHVALFNSEAVGVIGGAMTGPNVGEIFVLYVDETYRYKGIGKRLLEVFTKQQIDSGATEQWVSVQDENQRGIPFYEARGFLYQKEKNSITDTGEKQVSLRYSRQLD